MLWNFNMPPKTDEQMSNGWLVSFLNDQHMSIVVRGWAVTVARQKYLCTYIIYIYAHTNHQFVGSKLCFQGCNIRVQDWWAVDHSTTSHLAISRLSTHTDILDRFMLKIEMLCDLKCDTWITYNDTLPENSSSHLSAMPKGNQSLSVSFPITNMEVSNCW